MISSSHRKNLVLALVLGLVLLLLSYSRIVGDSQSMGFRGEVLETVFGGVIWGSKLMWHMVWFVVALIALHLSFGAICWRVGTLSATLSPKAEAADQAKHERQHVVLWFALFTIAVLAFNSAQFTRSSLGSPYAIAMSSPVLGVGLGVWISSAIVLAALAVVTLYTAKKLRSGWRPYRDSRRFAAGVLAIVVPCLVAGWTTANHSHNDGTRTNVVLIGIDSLRTDIVGKRGPEGVAPHLREFLEGSVRFTDTMTPLARTFPSVMSILTGRQPHKTGAYMNLPPRDFIHEGDTLGRIFGRAGYHSVFAMDEVRFANIDQSYGFDQAVIPPAGATEFLMTLFADTPLSNCVMNTRLGSWLFPYIHANRGAAGTYDPDTFLNRIDREVKFGNPLFFATHLTLSHWPYTWAGAPLPEKNPGPVWPDYYINVTHRVDRQFADLMSILDKRGVLDNAIVVVYSDHGESFGLPGESLVPDRDPLMRALAAVPQWGHGSTVFTTHQYKVVLGMRGFGAAAKSFPGAREVTAPASVMDIAPTLTQLAGASTSTPFDGFSLVPLMSGDGEVPAQFVHRVRFTETEYNPVGVATPDGKMSTSGIAKAAEMYRIDPVTDRIEVRQENLVPMLTVRQYAALSDDFLVAAVPYRSEGLTHHFLVVPATGGPAQLLTHAPGADSPADLRRAWDALQGNFAGAIPTAEKLESVVAKTTVASGGQAVTTRVTK
jgi:arylsulfatase A-like enzyme